MAHLYDNKLSTGLTGLDLILKGLLPGDNIVWQVDNIEEYKIFVQSYSQFAHDQGKELIYFRFANYEPLISEEYSPQMHVLDPEKGFETFINDVHQVIKENGRGGYYVFDCLSDLADHWYSDEMLGNFFKLTCPYLFDIEAIAYFSLYRNYHSFHATTAILETTQIFLDLFHYKDNEYIQPIKVQYRYSPTMYMLHMRKGDDFPPVRESATISEVLTSVPRLQLSSSSYEIGVWNRTFFQTEEFLDSHPSRDKVTEEETSLLDRVIKIVMSRDERVSQLIKKYFSLEDILKISKRVVGTGLIGGKSIGMLLSRAVLEKSNSHWKEILEPHDSFYIGSDVFYNFLVKNGIWWERQRQKDTEYFLEGSARARQRVLLGEFPEYITKQLNDLLDYFGQSPFIVRSSSLLEDNFGNAFAGKYESVFCVNQGPRIKRFEDLTTAIKTIYASAMSEKALTYRAQRGLLEHDEQMALLVQRVSGAFYDKIFTPQIAGVGFSFNPYVWSEDIDPHAGVLRLVFGLGTRAVDRSDDDYTRVVALNQPEKRPETNLGEIQQYTQKNVDILDFEANQLVSRDFTEIVQLAPQIPIHLLASRYRPRETHSHEYRANKAACWTLTFDKLLTQTNFVKDMRDMLSDLSEAYDYPVDIEFTCNFIDENTYKINLVQCRPFQVKDSREIENPPTNIDKDDLLFKVHGAIIGHSRINKINRFVYVVPSVYGEMPIRDRYKVARIIGELMHIRKFYQDKTIMLLGPGRWGTSSPELGIPISFSEINTISVLGEIVAMRDKLIPDVSLGTHLFSELVEMDILYLALFPNQKDNCISNTFFEESPNALTKYLPDRQDWAHVVKVVELDNNPATLNANAFKQNGICYLTA